MRSKLANRFYIDPATGSPHIHEHQVAEDEVIEVLEKPGEDRAGREGSRIALGQTASGRYLRVLYVPEPDNVFVVTAHDLTGMSQNRFPDGWDEDRVRRVLEHYSEQTEDEALAEDEAGVESSETVMNVPHDLVPKVRELIAKHHS